MPLPFRPARKGAAILLLFALLQPAAAAAQELSGFLELGPVYFEPDGYVLVEPGVGWESEALSVTLAAPVLLRVVDRAPREGGLLRREDWDEASDFGQLLRRFRLSLGEGAVLVRAGALSWERIGHGTLVSGYANTLDPDRHPAGAAVSVSAGAVSAQALWSDVTRARAGGGALVVEPLSLWGEPNDRVHLLAQGALDLQAPGDRALALWGVGVDAAVLRTSLLRLSPYADYNRRGRGQGLHAGLLADLTLAGVEVGLRAEWRRLWGPYQPEYFDVAYEIERTDLLGAPKAAFDFGVGNAFRGEARVRYRSLAVALAASSRGSGVHDASALVGADVGELSVALFAAARAFGGGRGPDKVLARGEVRYRLNEYLHLWFEGGRIYRLLEGAAVPLTRVGAGVGGALGWEP